MTYSIIAPRIDTESERPTRPCPPPEPPTRDEAQQMLGEVERQLTSLERRKKSLLRMLAPTLSHKES